MCGICGYKTLTTSSIEPSDVVAKMNLALAHRGPDDSGQFDTIGCSLAMRRLAIIDLATGKQPIYNEDERLVIVFNGEIYNYQELRDSLVTRGHQFRTQSDTETIIHLYEDKGVDCVRDLKGMFALCIYDQKKETLFLARDRFGEKPLYYYHHPEHGFSFSSEITSLLQNRNIPREINYEALGYYLRVGYVPDPITLFKDIYILPPGHWLRWEDGRIKTEPYFHVHYRPDSALDNEQQAIEAVQHHLRQAVKRQSISDVPLGAFLSGGIDSSSVVANLQEISNRQVNTFTMRFEDAAYDESKIAAEVARHLGTNHHEFVVPNTSFTPEIFDHILNHVGLPFIDSSAVPTYILSQQIRKHVTVALSGDGGDELFAGYPIFKWGQTIDRVQKIPPLFTKSSESFVQWLSTQPYFSNQPTLRRVRRGLEAINAETSFVPIIIQSIYEQEELARLVTHAPTLAHATSRLELLTKLPEEAQEWSILRRLMYYRLKHNLHDDMLTKVDRMSMSASIEVRAPMLDADLADLSMKLPDKHLIQNGLGKSILRKAMRKKLPDSVFEHPKSGFSIPLHKFQNEAYKDMVTDLLGDSSGIAQLFAKDELTAVIQRGLYQKGDNAQHSVYRVSHQLWSLAQLAGWQKKFNVSL